MFQTKFLEKMKMHFYDQLLFFLKFAIYEIMWKKIL
jgi:hypothetical protein